MKSQAPIGVIKLLLDKGAPMRNLSAEIDNIWGTTFGMAIDANNPIETLQFLLEQGAQIPTGTDYLQDTILSKAVSNGVPPETIQLLLDNGAMAGNSKALREAFNNKNRCQKRGTDEAVSNQIIELLLPSDTTHLDPKHPNSQMVEAYESETAYDPVTSALKASASTLLGKDKTLSK